MPSGDGVRSPRHLLALFLGTTFVLLTALGWLGWQALQQDRRVEAQLVHDRLESATELIAAQIRQNLIDIEEQLSRLSALPADAIERAASDYSKALGENALIVVFEEQRVTAYPAERLLYYPVLAGGPEAPLDRFTYGEVLEFKDRDFKGATAYFDKLARSSDDTAVRAGALLRLARNQRKAGQSGAALDTYAALAGLADTFLGGWPADLRARKARCDLLEQLGRREALAAEATTLHADLHTGRWPLTRATFAYLTGEVRRWLANGAAPDGPSANQPGGPGGPSSVALALAANVDSLWERWQRDRRTADMVGTKSNVESRDQSTSLLWRGTTNRVVALVSGPGFLDHHIVGPMRDLIERQGVGLILEDAEGRIVLSDTTGGSEGQYVLRTMAETRLPWSLRVVSADPAADSARLTMRRWLLIGGLSLLALLAVAGSYFSARAMTREIQAAQLQSEFVAAVSHEFRTPLTSLRQFTDLLADGRVSDEAERRKYYAVLQRGNRRLTRLVENLLDFGRMEAGFYRFVRQTVRAREVVAGVTAEFAEEIRPRGYDVSAQWKGPQDPLIEADEAALGRAIWNLLDNAVKYSPECKTIWVEGVTAGDRLTISVRDKGIGIAAPEHRAIFRKFVRGTLPAGNTIKGTGLGLALVDQIVRAHGGHVQVESVVGEGSTFSLVLPIQAALHETAREPASAEAQS